jgi:DNA oxidative demethylase
MPDLFSTAGLTEAPKDEIMAPGAMLLRGFALPFVEDILRALGDIAAQAPFRHMTTRWGAVMSVAMTNCGEFGWLTDRAGYRYDRIDPETGRQWPDMPGCFRALARSAADRAGYPGFAPDACLINRYAPGTRLTPHQDRDERDYAHPIVSVSLGLPASFQFGGAKRRDPMRKLPLRHGDVVVWGNESRLAYHGIAELKDGRHPLLGALRINLTFRRAL